MKSNKYLKYLNEKEEQSNEIAPPDDAVQIFYSDLNGAARDKVRQALQAADDDIYVEGDVTIKGKMEDAFSKEPLLLLRGSELLRKMNFNF